MKKLLLIICLITVGVCTAQNTTDAITKKFFSIYKTDTNAAIDYLFSTNTYFKTAEYNQIKDKINAVKEMLGNYQGYEAIGTKTTGSNYLQITFMVKYDREPLRFILDFYRPATTWQLHNFKFDEDIKAELTTKE